MASAQMPQTAEVVAAGRVAPGRPRLHRHPERGMLGGVCAGLAERLDVPVAVVRLLAAALAAVGGVGVAIYAAGWALTPVAPQTEGAGRGRPAWWAAGAAVLAIVAMGMLLRLTGLWLGERFVWPAVLGICGVALVWRPTLGQAGSRVERRARWWQAYWRGPGGRIDAPRLAIGGLLVAFGLAGLLHSFGVQHDFRAAIVAVVIVGLVLSVLVAPWFVRLGRNLAIERTARIREQERAEVAAHLHDSVLQTLALIQKRAQDSREVAALARRQERELRRWLFERPGGPTGDSTRGALERAAVELEELHGVPIEVVIVGDAPLEPRVEALVLAAREAMTNAAKFSGSDHVDLYAEIEDGVAELFVRDRGAGFDVGAIGGDRRGIRDSIIGRVERHGGRATVASAPGEGTEVELQMDGLRT